MTVKNTLYRNQTLLIISCLAIIWFALLGYRDLIDPDEGRYAEIPREMVVSGDWLTPRLDGFKYFEKPALQYWLTATSFKLFGISNTTARLPVAVLAFMAGLWILYLGNRLFGKPAGVFAFLIMMSSMMYVIMGHTLTLDMGVAVFLAAGVGALLLAQQDRNNQQQVRNWMLVGWAALALATLVKGLIGIVLPGLALVIYSLWQKDWILWKHLHIGKGLLLFLAITAPWFIAVSHQNPEFAHFFFIHEHFERYTSTEHNREEPIYFHLLLLILGSMPWTWSCLRALFKPNFAQRTTAAASFDPVRFLWVYIISILLFFTMSKSALPPYILPLFPALALLTGRQIMQSRSFSGNFIGFGLPLVLLIYAVITMTDNEKGSLLISLVEYRNWVIAACIVLLLGIASGLLFRKHLYKAMVSMAISGLLTIQLISLGFQTLSAHRSGHEMAKAIQAQVTDDVPVYNIGHFVHSLPFYLGREVIPVEYVGELELGIKQRPEHWIRDWPTFRERWLQSDQAVLVFGRKAFEDMKQEISGNFPMKIIYQDYNKTAVVRK